MFCIFALLSYPTPGCQRHLCSLLTWHLERGCIRRSGRRCGTGRERVTAATLELCLYLFDMPSIGSRQWRYSLHFRRSPPHSQLYFVICSALRTLCVSLRLLDAQNRMVSKPTSEGLFLFNCQVRRLEGAENLAAPSIKWYYHQDFYYTHYSQIHSCLNSDQNDEMWLV